MSVHYCCWMRRTVHRWVSSGSLSLSPVWKCCASDWGSIENQHPEPPGVSVCRCRRQCTTSRSGAPASYTHPAAAAPVERTTRTHSSVPKWKQAAAQVLLRFKAWQSIRHFLQMAVSFNNSRKSSTHSLVALRKGVVKSRWSSLHQDPNRFPQQRNHTVEQKIHVYFPLTLAFQDGRTYHEFIFLLIAGWSGTKVIILRNWKKPISYLKTINFFF